MSPNLQAQEAVCHLFDAWDCLTQATAVQLPLRCHMASIETHQPSSPQTAWTQENGFWEQCTGSQATQACQQRGPVEGSRIEQRPSCSIPSE